MDEAWLETLRRLTLAAEYREDDSHGNTGRVGTLAALPEQLSLILRTGEQIALTHDERCDLFDEWMRSLPKLPNPTI